MADFNCKTGGGDAGAAQDRRESERLRDAAKVYRAKYPNAEKLPEYEADLHDMKSVYKKMQSEPITNQAAGKQFVLGLVLAVFGLLLAIVIKHHARGYGLIAAFCGFVLMFGAISAIWKTAAARRKRKEDLLRLGNRIDKTEEMIVRIKNDPSFDEFCQTFQTGASHPKG